MRWTEGAECMGVMRNTYKILFEKLEGKILHRWEDNIRMDLRDIGWEGVG
jgi:hypothetical protein